MAKTYINTVKYEIRMRFEIDGIVDKPDIIGAIFGQSEGLLGDEMDLKELQKNGKVGRIEINLSTSMGRTKGEVLVPSSMDMAETSLLAAGIESVDKVGPCTAKFEIVDIEDTRTSKREEIKDRAKELLKRMMEKTKPEMQSISEEIKENARAADITEYGPDKLPAGPDIDESNEIIVVEGRADVLNLLKNQIRNVIGMNGSNISPTISKLSREKEITLFIDGDRGGLLNARKLCQLARVNYIAKAPDGKEVEELTRKEILQSLKKKLPPEEAISDDRRFEGPVPQIPLSEKQGWERHYTERPGQRWERPRMRSVRSRNIRGMPRRMGDDRGMNSGSGARSFRRHVESPNYSERTHFAEETPNTRSPALSSEEETTFRPIMDQLRGTMKAKILDEKNHVVKEVKVKDIVNEITSTTNASAVVFDGVITKRLVEAAEQAGIKYVVGVRKGKIEGVGKVKAVAL